LREIVAVLTLTSHAIQLFGIICQRKNTGDPHASNQRNARAPAIQTIDNRFH
jgi:hypothetical protein